MEVLGRCRPSTIGVTLGASGAMSFLPGGRWCASWRCPLTRLSPPARSLPQHGAGLSPAQGQARRASTVLLPPASGTSGPLPALVSCIQVWLVPRKYSPVGGGGAVKCSGINKPHLPAEKMCSVEVTCPRLQLVNGGPGTWVQPRITASLHLHGQEASGRSATSWRLMETVRPLLPPLTGELLWPRGLWRRFSFPSGGNDWPQGTAPASAQLGWRDFTTHAGPGAGSGEEIPGTAARVCDASPFPTYLYL